MSEDYSELVEYLDKKFNKIDKEFIDVKSQILVLDGKVNDLQENKADKKDVSELLDAVDAYSAKSDKYFQEMIMTSRKSDRHEQWIHQIADKVGVKLGY